MTNVLVPKLCGYAKTLLFFLHFQYHIFSVGEILHVVYKKYIIIRKFTFYGKYQIYFIL